MFSIAQRIESLRMERNISRPALAAELGFPKMAFERFETGRQTPTQAQQERIAAYFGVSVAYLRGESDDRTSSESWMERAFAEKPEPVRPAPQPKRAAAAPRREEPVASAGETNTTMLNAFLNGKDFQDALRAAVRDVLRSPEGQALIAKAVRENSK
ncbi:MAG: helix-turn-helix transcriptional regulator [Eubacteriales bacterium]|nr:helix-turn-helix transcriptional regulator [Eubacteriales bacterium]